MMLVRRSPTRTGSESETLSTGRMTRLYSLFFNRSSYSRLASNSSSIAAPTDVISRDHVTTTTTEHPHIGATVERPVGSLLFIQPRVAQYRFRSRDRLAHGCRRSPTVMFQDRKSVMMSAAAATPRLCRLHQLLLAVLF